MGASPSRYVASLKGSGPAKAQRTVGNGVAGVAPSVGGVGGNDDGMTCAEGVLLVVDLDPDGAVEDEHGLLYGVFMERGRCIRGRLGGFEEADALGAGVLVG